MEHERDSLLIAETHTDVTTLNTRARHDRIRSGQVGSDGVDLHDGTRAGVGDHIVTRRNDRRLTNRPGTRFVRNGDTWTVRRHHRNGDLTVQATTGQDNRAGGEVRLPHAYDADHVELAYATTTAQAQGRTVETAHVLIGDTTTRASLYVAATRARHSTQLYVTTDRILDLDAERPPSPHVEAHDRLVDILGHEGEERTAAEVNRAAPAPATHRQLARQPHRAGTCGLAESASRRTRRFSGAAKIR